MPQGFEKKGKIMAEFLVRHYALTIALSQETREFLANEIEEIQKHCDITDHQHDELTAIREGLLEMDAFTITH